MTGDPVSHWTFHCSPARRFLRRHGCFQSSRLRGSRGLPRTGGGAIIARGDVLVERLPSKPVSLKIRPQRQFRVLAHFYAARPIRSIVVHRAGQFTGESNMITGRRALVRSLWSASLGESSSSPASELFALVQTDAEFSSRF